MLRSTVSPAKPTGARRRPSSSIKVSLERRPRRLISVRPSPPLLMLSLIDAARTAGNFSTRSVALRTPSRAISSRRYVSTGCGPTSSAVGIFEPVTITSTVVTAGWLALAPDEVFCASTTMTGKKTIKKLTRYKPGLAAAFIAEYSATVLANPWGGGLTSAPPANRLAETRDVGEMVHLAKQRAVHRMKTALVSPKEFPGNPAAGRRNRLEQ